jgi:hypothetical protein
VPLEKHFMTNNSKHSDAKNKDQKDSNKNETVNRPGAEVVDYGRSEQKEVEKKIQKSDHTSGPDRNAE